MGRIWLNIRRVKTNVSASIPLLAPARIILERYQPNWRSMPPDAAIFKRMSNQKVNSYLKEIADLCGITKPVSFHISRHSFASTITLSNNIPIETVSKLMGHKRISMTQHYGKVVDQKVDRDIAALSEKLDELQRLRDAQNGEGIIRRIKYK